MDALFLACIILFMIFVRIGISFIETNRQQSPDLVYAKDKYGVCYEVSHDNDKSSLRPIDCIRTGLPDVQSNK
jgi:hypothetical protein